MSNRIERVSRRVLPALGLMLLAGCAKNAPQDFLHPEGDPAKTINTVNKIIFPLAGIVAVLVFIGVAVILWKFKDRGQPMPHQGHGKSTIEIGSIVVSASLLVVVAVPTFSTIFDLAETDDCNMVINVTGQQWWWEFAYPVQDGIDKPIVTSGDIVIPEGECVMLRITSRDVIHSFWVPKLNGKKDAVPNRVHTLRFQADQPGVYLGQCAEFCGLSHANMKMNAIALTRADFATWVANQTAEKPMASEGQAGFEGQGVYSSYCTACHQVDGLKDPSGNPVVAQADTTLVAGAAPNLTHLMSRITFAGGTYWLQTEKCRDDLFNASPEEFGALYLKGVDESCLNRIELEEWLRNAPAKKAMYPTLNEDGLGRGMPYLALSEDQIDSLVEYLLTLQ
ncbi:MAG: cytochrome c oxidase subunit II [Ilumatobacteraceae bacterium]